MHNDRIFFRSNKRSLRGVVAVYSNGKAIKNSVIRLIKPRKFLRVNLVESEILNISWNILGAEICCYLIYDDEWLMNSQTAENLLQLRS